MTTTERIGVWNQLVGQEPAVETLASAAAAAAKIVAGEPAPPGAMTHAWLLTGPPGSGRSVAARTFAAALQCSTGTGCDACPGCHTTMAGTHADVRLWCRKACRSRSPKCARWCRRPRAVRRPATGRS